MNRRQKKLFNKKARCKNYYNSRLRKISNFASERINQKFGDDGKSNLVYLVSSKNAKRIKRLLILHDVQPVSCDVQSVPLPYKESETEVKQVPLPYKESETEVKQFTLEFKSYTDSLDNKVMEMAEERLK